MNLLLTLTVVGLMVIMTVFSGWKTTDRKHSELIGLFDVCSPGVFAFSNPFYEIVQVP